MFGYGRLNPPSAASMREQALRPFGGSAGAFGGSAGAFGGSAGAFGGSAEAFGGTSGAGGGLSGVAGRPRSGEGYGSSILGLGNNPEPGTGANLMKPIAVEEQEEDSKPKSMLGTAMGKLTSQI